ncbi:Sin-like protein conserved region-domain-containing protein [Limtongia smithiae]|uniref:Sin-like protein conserved region-domain-containing protein n=1 Tax=Limtongia smithiae TaxID=1125753 RepID=UPI0034CD2154
MSSIAFPFEIKEEEEDEDLIALNRQHGVIKIEDDTFMDIDGVPDVNTAPSIIDSATPTGLETDDIEDPIIADFPIFLSTQLADHLHVLQYPSRHRSRPYTGSSAVLDFRSKPEAGIVQLDIPMDTTRFYDTEKGARWGDVDRQTLGGVVVHNKGHMVGIFQDGELHLTPIKGTAQMRPAFTYIDKDVQTEKEIARSTHQDPAKSKELRAVQMTVKSSDNAGPRYSGALAARKKAEDEQFIDMRWTENSSTEAWDLAERLRASRRDPLVPATSREAYADLLRDP